MATHNLKLDSAETIKLKKKLLIVKNLFFLVEFSIESVEFSSLCRIF